jgi:acylphosphatase
VTGSGGHPTRVAVRMIVRGRVQGVGFRASCRHAAVQAGVDGWARNLPDGGVEAWLEGPRDAVDAVAGWCRVGPRHASVTGIEIHDEVPTGETGFRVR